MKTEVEDMTEITELDKVINFRLQWLLDAGYTTKHAEKIAETITVDWHFACDLRKHCSDEKLCMRILF